MKKLFSVALLVFCLTLGLTAQNAVATSGGEGSGSGGSVSYTIGQVFYQTNASISEGVQQAYEILTVGIQDQIAVDMKLNVYPNPTVDLLTLNVENYENKKLSYQLYSVNGLLLSRKQITANITQIDMVNRVPSIYFLKITNQNQTIKTFKIIKN